jgi:hypothetical protein
MDKMSIFFLPSNQNRGGSDRGGLPAAGGSLPGHGDDRE